MEKEPDFNEKTKEIDTLLQYPEITNFVNKEEDQSKSEITNLIFGSVNAPNLSSILTEICNILKKHSSSLKIIEQQSQNSITEKNYKKDKDNLNEEINELRNKIMYNEKIISEITQKQEKMENNFNESFSSLKTNIEGEINQINNKNEEENKSQRIIMLETNKKQSKTNKETEDNIHSIKDEILELKQKINLINHDNLIESVSKVESFDTILNNTITETDKKIEENQNEIKTINEKIAKEEEMINEEMKKIDARIIKVEQDVSFLPDADKIDSVNDPNLMPVLRGVQRNSRRIDYFDKSVAEMKLQYKETCETVQNCCNLIGNFSTEVENFNNELGKTRSEFCFEFGKQRDALNVINKQINKIWSSVKEISSTQTNAINEILDNSDKVAHELACITKRSAAKESFLEDILLASNQSTQDIDERCQSNKLGDILNSKVVITSTMPIFNKPTLENIHISNTVHKEENTQREGQIVQEIKVVDANAPEIKDINKLEAELAGKVSKVEFERMIDIIQETNLRLKKEYQELEQRIENVSSAMSSLATANNAAHEEDNSVNLTPLVLNKSFKKVVPTSSRPRTVCSSRQVEDGHSSSRTYDKKLTKVPLFQVKHNSSAFQSCRLASHSIYSSPSKK